MNVLCWMFVFNILCYLLYYIILYVEKYILFGKISLETMYVYNFKYVSSM